uniref:Uncharacterized protein n=2 Tax=Parascaris univalens TaxID=6257 RepID=A0A914ZXM8_PARUN
HQADLTSTGTSLGSSSQLPSTSSYDRAMSGPLFASVRSDSVSTNLRNPSGERATSFPKQPSYMREWRKWRRALAGDSDRGERPLEHDSWWSSRFLLNETAVVCCKHGRKCTEYFEEMSNRLPSLWPTSQFISVADTPIHAQSSLETFKGADASQMEILHRYYIGRKTRERALPKPRIAQTFRLYHEIPESLNTVDSLKLFVDLYVVFVTNNLSLRHFRVKEVHSALHKAKRIYVECGDRYPPLFWGLHDLVWHYSTIYAYIDSKGQRSRFPS